MNRNYVCRMLVLGLILIGLTSCSSKATFGLNWGRVEESRASIDKVIAEPERRAEVHAVVDAYVADAGKIADEVKAIRMEIVEKNREYDTTREELQALYDQIESKLDQLVATAAEHGAELRKHCSKAEWEEIFDHDDDMVNFKY